MPLDTDFNTPPYWDDYNEDKKFYRMLFRPSTAVQARELTQLQTILQNQVERFGNHIFKNGSVVEGCHPSTLQNLDFVRLSDNFDGNTSTTVFEIANNYLLVGNTSGVKASPVFIKKGLLINYPDTNRIYIKYIAGGNSIDANTSHKVFANGETITIYNENQNKFSNTLNSNNIFGTIKVITEVPTVNCVGKGYGLVIEEGVVYHKGFFQKIDTQSIIIKDYDQEVGNYVVGFDSTEEIITEDQDSTLLDNALGSPNENAPGAHRLRLDPTPVAKLRAEIANNDSFFAVYEFSNDTNELLMNRTKSTYDELGQVFDLRTFEESGDYVTKPFLTEAVPTSNTDTFAYRVDTGIGYVHGSRVEFNSSNKVEVEKAITTKEAQNQTITANYGNFVYVNQVEGALSFDSYVTVDIHNTAYSAISNYGHSNGSIPDTNKKIGSAKIRAVAHDSGDPGLPTTSYRLYLTDITMTGDHSFLNEAKSIVANSAVNNGLGKYCSDIVLVSGQAKVYDGSLNTLIFPFNKKGLKRLKSSSGTINDTQFVYKKSSVETMSTSGVINVTLSGYPSGGLEIPAYNGVLTDSLEKEIILSLAQDARSANLAGTVSITGNTVVGTGLNTSFGIGEHIYLNVTKKDLTESWIERRVVDVASTGLTLTIDQPIEPVADTLYPVTMTAVEYAKYYPAGYNIPLSSNYPGTKTIVANSTSLQINTGISLETQKNVVVQFKKYRQNAIEAKKDVYKNTHVKLYFANNVKGFLGPWDLGFSDVFRINKVYASSAAFSNSSADDFTNFFDLDTGQASDSYNHSKLLLKPQFTGQLNTKPYITVVFDHFVANTDNGVGFFSVESYPTVNGAANSTTINIAEIPVFKSGSATYDLRDCIDFRPYKSNTAVISTTLSGATINPIAANSYISSTTVETVEPDSTFEADIEYYLGRTDLVTISTMGTLNVVKGVPADDPITPKAPGDVMVLATASVPPFPSLSVQQLSTYPRSDYVIKISSSTNRGYTMKDIGVLDQRIQRLEYYTTLNALEQKTENLTIQGVGDLNRFKNGIFVDPMDTDALAQSDDLEYKWSIDINRKLGRPPISRKNIGLTYSSGDSTNVIQSGNYITLPYTHELLFSQPYATKIRNNAQDFWSWKGSCEIYPAYDMNKDTTSLPNIQFTVDLYSAISNFARVNNLSMSTTSFGDWVTTASVTSTWSNFFAGGGTTVTQQQRQETTSTLVAQDIQQNSPPLVSDITVQPFMKERTIAFVARNLKPNTRVYAFFDDVPVSDKCAQGVLNTSILSDLIAIDSSYATSLQLPAGWQTSQTSLTFNQVVEIASAVNKSELVVKRTNAIGTPMITGADGSLYGVFNLPANSFRVGDRKLQIVDVDSLVTGSDAAITSASAMFTASNIAVQTRGITLTTITPQIQTSTSTGFRTLANSWSWIRLEPIGQSITINAPDNQTGVFLTKMDLFFKKKDTSNTLGLTLVICDMVDNVPDTSKTYGSCYLTPSEINVSDNASAPTSFTFTQPIFLNSGHDYAFYILPESNCPDYQMWMSEIGGVDVLTNSIVYSNPYVGDAFRSSNAKTWTAMPKEDIKFNLYVANFEVGTGTAVFNNENDEYFKYSNFLFKAGVDSIGVNDEVYLINSASNVTITNTAVKGFVQGIDQANYMLELDASTGGFIAGRTIGVFRVPNSGNSAQANSVTLRATMTIDEIQNPVLHSVVPRFSILTPTGTVCSSSFKGVDIGQNLDNEYYDVTNDNEREMLDYERKIFSKSNANKKSIYVKHILTNSNKYVSPVVDLRRKAALVIENLINNEIAGEYARNGKSKVRYISQPVILADGQEAEDLKVYLTGYRPSETDIDVYVKFINGEDTTSFDDRSWTKMDLDNPETRSSSINIYDWKEYTYSVPSIINTTTIAALISASGASVTTVSIAASYISYISVGDYVNNDATNLVTAVNLTNNTITITSAISVTSGNYLNVTKTINDSAYKNASNLGIIQYVSNGSTFVNFKKFMIKIVLRSTSGIYVPKVNDIRSLALQV